MGVEKFINKKLAKTSPAKGPLKIFSIKPPYSPRRFSYFDQIYNNDDRVGVNSQNF